MTVLEEGKLVLQASMVKEEKKHQAELQASLEEKRRLEK